MTGAEQTIKPTPIAKAPAAMKLPKPVTTAVPVAMSKVAYALNLERSAPVLHTALQVWSDGGFGVNDLRFLIKAAMPASSLPQVNAAPGQLANHNAAAAAAKQEAEAPKPAPVQATTPAPVPPTAPADPYDFRNNSNIINMQNRQRELAAKSQKASNEQAATQPPAAAGAPVTTPPK